MQSALIAIIAVFACVACTTVRTTNAGYTGALAAKDENCAIRFYRLGPPSSDYEEIGSALLEGSILVSPAAAERELRARACELGADAVVITDERYAIPFYGSTVQAVFIAKKEDSEASVMPQEPPLGSEESASLSAH